MRNLPRLSLKPISPRFFLHSGFWIWVTILLSIVVTGSVSWLRFRQQQVIRLATTQLEDVRLARIDLSKGFLYTTLAGAPDSPFNGDAGLALLNQAITSLDQTLVDLGPEAAESAEAFRKSVDTFQGALTEWAQATTSRPDKAAGLRIAFRDLEYQAERIDTHTQQGLNRLSDRLDAEFAAALGVSAFMLASICGIVFLTGRAREESEAALRESERRYRLITQALTDYIYTVQVEDGRAVKTTHSPACVAVTGYTSEELAANPDLWLIMVDKEDHPAVLEQARRLLDDQDAQAVEHRITRKDGAKRWVRNTPVPLLDPDGKMLSYDGLIQDITARKQAEKALQESESRYRSLIENQSEVIARSDTSGRLTVVNDAYCRAFGQSREEIIGHVFTSTVFPEDVSISRAVLQAIQSPPYRAQSETRHLTPQGLRWFEWENSAVLDENGEVVEFQGAGRDITERKQAMAELAEIQALLRSVIEQSPVPIAAAAPDGTVTIFNQASLEFLGIENEPGIEPGLNLFTMKRAWQDLDADGNPVPPDQAPLALALQGKATKRKEMRVLRKDGTERWEEVDGVPIYDEDENLIAGLIIFPDITERKRVEEALRASEENYRLLFKANPVPMWVYDAESLAFLAVNDFAVDHYGYSREEFLSMTIRDIRPAEDIPYLHEVLRKHTGKLRKVGLARHCKKDGSLIDVEITGHEIEFEGHRAMLVLAMDVTERQRAEEEIALYRNRLEELVDQRTAELRAANDQLLVLTLAKDEFVSNVSHELRTPISSLKLRQHLLENHPDQLDKHIDVLKRETDRLARTIEDLLQLSRLDQRRIEFHLVTVDLNDLAGQYVADRLPIANEKGLALSFQGEADLPDIVADAGLLGQALSTLLTNAINYTPAGGQVVVRTHARRDAGKRWVGFSVADTGPGISPEEQPLLFDRFFRGGAGRRSGVPGTGLGLSIAQEIINRHGGNIEVESDGVPGHGSTFRMWIPIEGIADDEPAGS